MQTKVFHIIIPTPLTREEFHKTSYYQCIRKICNVNNSPFKGFDCVLVPFYENKKGLSELYQEYLNGNDVKEYNVDYVVFMHDDLEVHDFFIFDKLVKAHEQFDIVGLAGATAQDYTRSHPPVWHLSAIQSSNGRGIVGHHIPAGMGGYPSPYVNSAFFGPTPSPVVVIDGLFMSVKIKSLEGLPDLFDPEYTFHFYDLNFSANAIKNNLKLGVWPIYCLHSGLGEFKDDKLWNELSIKFKNKYKDYKTYI